VLEKEGEHLLDGSYESITKSHRGKEHPTCNNKKEYPE
jgi:hypothetical protein